MPRRSNISKQTRTALLALLELQDGIDVSLGQGPEIAVERGAHVLAGHARLQHVGEAADLVVEFPVGDVAGNGGLVALEDDGGDVRARAALRLTRFAGLPLFAAANRMNAYNTYLLMEHEGP